MNPFAAKSYHSVDLETGVHSADAHRLIAMLIEGALESIRAAEGHLAAGRLDEKSRAINKVIRIITEGLRSSLDRKAGGDLAEKLGQLYDYMTARLLRANLRNEVAVLHEVAALMSQVQAGWNGIAPKRNAGPGAPALAKAALAAAANSSAAVTSRGITAFAQQLQERRLAVSV